MVLFLYALEGLFTVKSDSNSKGKAETPTWFISITTNKTTSITYSRSPHSIIRAAVLRTVGGVVENVFMLKTTLDLVRTKAYADT